jgi:hypothetical protein
VRDSFDDEGGISGDARRMGRVFRASLAGRRRAIGNLAGLFFPQEGKPAEIERVFAAIEEQSPHAVLVSGEGDLYANRQLIAELALKKHLPTICPYRDYVEDGALMGYALDLPELFRRMADDVHKISKVPSRATFQFIRPPNSSCWRDITRGD